MGTGYAARCKACGHRWDYFQGGGFAYFQVVCDTCGGTESRPRSAPKVLASPMTNSELRAYVRDSDPDWSLEGRAFSKEEKKRMEALFAHCGCGGKYFPEDDSRAMPRCPECRSLNFTKEMTCLID